MIRTELHASNVLHLEIIPRKLSAIRVRENDDIQNKTEGQLTDEELKFYTQQFSLSHFFICHFFFPLFATFLRVCKESDAVSLMMKMCSGALMIDFNPDTCWHWVM